MAVDPHAGAMPIDALPVAPLATHVARLRCTIEGADPSAVVNAVEELLRRQRPGLGHLIGHARSGTEEGPESHVLHAEKGFSVVALALRPGQQTTVHDHVTWCVVAVLSGTEAETRYAFRGNHLQWMDESTNATGSVTALTPPGDIHRVRCAGNHPAVSLHVYGADLRAAGSSVRRTYTWTATHQEEIP